MRTLVFCSFLMLVASAANAQGPADATDITAAQIRAFVEKAPKDHNSDLPLRVVDAGSYHVGVFGVFRPKNTPPGANVHQTKVSEVYYILEGAGVLVTGGTLKKPATPRPSTLGPWTDLGSAGIDGGKSRRVSKGDVIIIPGGVPHMWASMEGDITYLIVRPDPDKKIPLK